MGEKSNNILVTGGCGFIGSNFVRFLLSCSDFNGKVINFDKLTYAGNPDNLKDIEKRHGSRYRFIQGDICHRDTVGDIFSRYQIERICHFAAESHVDRSITGPRDFITTNINGTFNLLEAAREHHPNLKCFHHISTDEVYGSLESSGVFTEESPYKPNSPYSASKAGSDHLVRAYHRTYDLPVTISNCSNNYGPYQFPEKFVPLAILNAIARKPIPVYGDGMNVRDWLYVLDHCSAIWSIIQSGRTGETYNIGGENQIENIKLVEIICDIIDGVLGRGKDPPRRDLINFVEDRPGHDKRYAVDSSKLKRETGWKPAELFESGLKKTIQWYIENNEWVSRVHSGAYRL